ncbi:hypothetical protein FACS1894216_10890 [Synergistales bacterium]|nr:hypothetical protein FACS1894216_10890 [Synergistales bacterium]
MSTDLDGIRSSLEKTKGMAYQGRKPYARIARAVFEEIEALRTDSIPLLTILNILEADGHLPDGSNVKALSGALIREKMRRGKEA